MSATDPQNRLITERRMRRAVLVLFGVDGLGFGVWASHLPAFKSALNLSDGGLSLALFAMIMGSLVSMPWAGRIISKEGSRRVVVGAAIVYGLMLPLIALSVQLGGGLALFTLAALVFGASKGALDVSANAQAMAAEQSFPKPIVSSCHGCWSLGSLVGAASAAFALRLSIPFSLTMLTLSLTLLALTLRSKAFLYQGDFVEPDAMAKPSIWPTGRLIPLGALAFVALFCEGAVSDWSAVYLAGPLGLTASAAASGFAVYMTAMTVGRFAGDRLVATFGPATLLRVGGLLVAVGLGGTLAFRTFPMALVGFGLVGLGLSNAVPVIFRSAGGGRESGAAIASVSTIGYLGFLAGPPMIGVLSEALGLQIALLVVVVFGLTMAVGARIITGRNESKVPSLRSEQDEPAACSAVLA